MTLLGGGIRSRPPGASWAALAAAERIFRTPRGTFFVAASVLLGILTALLGVLTVGASGWAPDSQAHDLVLFWGLHAESRSTFHVSLQALES